MPEPTVTPYLGRIQTDPQGSNPTATAFFGETTEIGGKTFEAPWESVSWPLQSDEEITLSDGTVLTYSQVSEGVTLIAYKARAEQQAAAEAAEEPAPEEPAPEEGP